MPHKPSPIKTAFHKPAPPLRGGNPELMSQPKVKATEDAKDIAELQRRIADFKAGKEDEERFKLYRLTRGVYGQRQFGVQMFRTKIPYGKITCSQLERLANISEQYTNGNLHLTTRQNVQLHFVKLSDSPAIWSALSEAGLTAREACGNTVRNITASAVAGIDPEEHFDVAPYVQAVFEYFLRNPICQEMGRKIKPAFSSSDKDSAFTYFHDFGFIPRLKKEHGALVRGFKVVVGGGLGAVGAIAQTAYDFLPADQIIPFMEASIRVFDRYGEREKRQKARMKFLVRQLGLEAFLQLVEEEMPGIANRAVPIRPPEEELPALPPIVEEAQLPETHRAGYERWKALNTFPQKQAGFFGVYIRVPRGDIHAKIARPLAEVVRRFAADDIRITVQQGLLLRFVRPEALSALYLELCQLGLHLPGAQSIGDITACPGTDTCALGVTNSTGLAAVLEQLLEEAYPHLMADSDIRIKISGCMNSCGQHMAAQIGFHGSSIKVPPRVVPAMQVVLGGGVSPEGEGFIAQKVIKLPTRRIPAALRLLLDDFEAHGEAQQLFNAYVLQQGKRYFYDLLKPLADTATLEDDAFIDWGQDTAYQQEIGVGECAGATLDVVGTILAESAEKLKLAKEALQAEAWGDAIYQAYTSMIIGAKALLLAEDIRCNTHKGILDDFQQHYIATERLSFTSDFKAYVLQMKTTPPSKGFALQYLAQAQAFSALAQAVRRQQLEETGGEEKLVIDNYYKA